MTTLDLSPRNRGGTDSHTGPPLRSSVGGARLLAAAVAVQPLLLGFNALFHPEVELTGESLLTAATTDPGGWFLVHVVAAVGAFLGVPAAFGLRRLVPQAGRRLATVGVGSAVVGGPLLAATFAAEASVLRLAAEMADRTGALSLADAYASAPEFYAVGAAIVFTTLGALFLGVSLLVGRNVPRWQSGLFLLGAVGTALAAPGTVIGPVAFGLVAIASLFLSRAIVQAGDLS